MIKKKKKPCKNPKNTEEGKLCYYFNREFGCADCTNKYKSKKEEVRKRAKAIRRVSSKRTRQNQAYSVLRKMFLKQHPNCAVFPDRESAEVHHSYGRRGDMLLDTRFWFAVSREGHDKIHANPEWAEEKGFLIKGRNSK